MKAKATRAERRLAGAFRQYLAEIRERAAAAEATANARHQGMVTLFDVLSARVQAIMDNTAPTPRSRRVRRVRADLVYDNPRSPSPGFDGRPQELQP